MGVIGWTIVGLLAGGLGRMLTGSRQHGCILTLVIGLIGAWIGGLIGLWIWDEPIGSFGLRSILLATAGAVVFLAGLRILGFNSKRR
jgi:uncharacterized membrane protein YeaQ/YmgE (transglycosylase-associated protein family)